MPVRIFLDQNHWIYLARACHGKSKALEPAMSWLYQEVSSGRIVLPIDAMHLIEVARADQAGSRQRLSAVLETYSQSWFFAAWRYVLPIEISRAVALALDREAPDPPEVIGRGYLFGFRDLARETFDALSEDQLAELEHEFSQPGALFDLLTTQAEVNRLLQKHEIGKLNTNDASSIEGGRGKFRRESKSLHRRAKRARHLYDHQTLIAAELSKNGSSLADLLERGQDDLEAFIESIPSLDVDTELTLFRDRQWSRPVAPNDFADIGHLALAVPYCDVVVVERFWAQGLRQSGLDKKYSIQVATSIESLPSLVGA